MIQSIYKLTLVLLCMTCFHASIKAESILKKETYTEVIERSFDINKEGDVELSNKYGKMEVITWDKPKVEVKVTITVKAKSKDDAQEEFDRIIVEFDNSSSFVSAKTEIEEKKSSWWGWSSSNSSDFKINYEVYLPGTVKLDAANKYGNMFIPTMDADLKVTQKYGNFDIDGVNGNLEFYLGYGNGTVAFAHNVEGYIKYSNLSIDKADNVELESKYSKMRFDQINELKSESKYDKYTIEQVGSIKNEGKYDHFDLGEVNELDIYTKYTDCRVDRLNQEASFDCAYGSVKIYKLSKDFNEIEIEGSYTSFRISREGSVGLEFDVETKYADIDVPSDSDFTKKIRDGSSKHYVGHTGSGNTNKRIEAELDYGSFELN